MGSLRAHYAAKSLSHGEVDASMQVLVIVAASHLDAVTFQICSQSFKIMPTAFFAVWLLGQYLTPLQWGSLPVLAVGVVFVTMNGSTPAGVRIALSSQLYTSTLLNPICKAHVVSAL